MAVKGKASMAKYKRRIALWLSSELGSALRWRYVLNA